MKHSQPNTVQAVIHLEVPEFQIGQEVSIYFKDTMYMRGTCEKPKMGRWIDEFGGCECSKCGCLEAGYSNYCPNCGAKMESEEKE